MINLLKADSLYNLGMLPLVHSEATYNAKVRLPCVVPQTASLNRVTCGLQGRAAMELQGVGWTRTGKDVCWYGNNIRRRFRERYYTLTFTLEAQHDFDLVSL